MAPRLGQIGDQPGQSTAWSAELNRAELHVGLDVSGLSGKKPAIIALFVAFAYLCSGVVAFHLLLDLTWSAAFYFAVTTSLTVGYGDIDAWTAMDNSSTANDGVDYEPSDGAIIFTTLYIIGGMIVMGTSLGLILQSLLEATSRKADSEPGFAARYPLIVSSTLCIATIFGGAAFVVATEDDADFVHGLYWAVVTMSTVGYGSGTPETDGGRLFAAFYMLFGVSCMANFVGELAERPLRAHRRKLENMVINQYGDTLDAGELLELAGSDQFQRLDLKPAPFKDGRGVSRDAFCLVMLARTDQLKADDLKRCQAAFDALDADGSGTLDMADIEEHARRAEDVV